MTPDAFLDAVNDAEKQHPVHEWVVDGVRAWPVVRNRAMRYNERARAEGGVASPGRGWAVRAHAAMRVATGAARAISSNRADASHRVPLRPGQADILLLGDAVSRVLVRGQWFDRFCDPVTEAASRLGLRTVHLEPNHHYRVPRAHPSRYVQPGLDVLDAATRLLPLPADRDDRQWHGVRAELLRAGVQPAALDPDAVAREIRLIRREAWRFSRFFRGVRPRLAIHVDYTPQAMAFTLAARRFGVPSVEIQHAMPPATHPMYARWRRTPPGGYELLPTHYWAWTESAADVLRAWTTRVHQGPDAFVGGSPWLERWLAGHGEHVRSYDDELATTRRLRGNPRQALLTFEATFSSDEVLEPMLAAATATRGVMSWWYRLHPTTNQAEAAHVRGVLAARGLDEKGADMTHLPLYAVLRNTDVHVTHASSTTQEAALFGVPTVLTAAHAGDVYPDLVGRGWATIATTAEDIATVALTMTPPDGDLVRAAAPPEVEATLERLLGTAAKGGELSV